MRGQPSEAREAVLQDRWVRPPTLWRGCKSLTPPFTAGPAGWAQGGRSAPLIAAAQPSCSIWQPFTGGVKFSTVPITFCVSLPPSPATVS